MIPEYLQINHARRIDFNTRANSCVKALLSLYIHFSLYPLCILVYNMHMFAKYKAYESISVLLYTRPHSASRNFKGKSTPG